MIESIFVDFEPTENANFKPIFMRNHDEGRKRLECVRTSETQVLRNSSAASNAQIRHLFHAQKTCSGRVIESISTFDF
jgi:hypothetical protein